MHEIVNEMEAKNQSQSSNDRLWSFKCPRPDCFSPDGSQWRTDATDKEHAKRLLEMHGKWHEEISSPKSSPRQNLVKKARAEKQVPR